jgi:cytochrome P450
MIRHWFSDVRAFRRDPLRLLQERGQQAKGPFAPLALGISPVLLVCDPTAVKQLLRMSESSIDKGKVVAKLRPILGSSSLTMSGDAQRERRAILHERLARGTAENYVPEMCATIRAASVDIASDSFFKAEVFGGTLALKLICVALFGQRVLMPCDETALIDAVHAIEADLQGEMFRFLPQLPWTARAQRKTRAHAKHALGFIIDRVAQRAGDASILQALGKLNISKDDIRDELMTMLIAGYHTTGSAIAWLIYFMASQPSLTEVLRAEARRVSDGNGEIDPKQLKNAPASLGAIKEVLRLYPPAWWTTREVKETCVFEGIALKAGTTLLTSPWQLHRSSKHFANPDSFDRERSFANPAYIPFGSGPRACVGMGVALLELQLLALELASAFSFETVDDKMDLTPVPGVILGPPSISVKASLRGSFRGDARAVA